MKRKNKVYVSLIHWPVLDRAGTVVVTNVTNFDIHDIARASRSYGVEKYYIVNRLKEQLSFVARVLEHWRVGDGAKYNPKRKSALTMVELKETLEDCLKDFEKRPLVVATSAKSHPTAKPIKFPELRQLIWEGDRDVFLVFGTGFGLHPDIYNMCDYLLEPMKGDSADDYRHLSVRSAVSICLDRLLST